MKFKILSYTIKMNLLFSLLTHAIFISIQVENSVGVISNVTRVLNSKIISASLGKGRHIQLSEPVRLTLKHIRTENVSNPSCVFWDYTMR